MLQLHHHLLYIYSGNIDDDSGDDSNGVNYVDHDQISICN